MIIGVPKEIKTREYRVGMTPAGVRSLTSRGHTVLIEQGAGDGSGLRDVEYAAQGAKLVPHAADAWSADLVVKVKEPLVTEHGYFHKDLVLFTRISTSRTSPDSRGRSRSPACRPSPTRPSRPPTDTCLSLKPA